MPDTSVLEKMAPFLAFAAFVIFLAILLVRMVVVFWPKRQYNKVYKEAVCMLMDIGPVTHEYKVKSMKEFKQFDPDSAMEQLALSKELNKDGRIISERIAMVKEADAFQRSIPTDIVRPHYLQMKRRIWCHIRDEHLHDISGVAISWCYDSGKKTYKNRKVYAREDVSSFCQWAKGVRKE